MDEARGLFSARCQVYRGVHRPMRNRLYKLLVVPTALEHATDDVRIQRIKVGCHLLGYLVLIRSHLMSCPSWKPSVTRGDFSPVRPTHRMIQAASNSVVRLN